MPTFSDVDNDPAFTSQWNNSGGFTGQGGGPTPNMAPGQQFQNAAQDPVSQMMQANPGMQSWVAQTYVQNGITPTGPGGGAGDWQYWQSCQCEVRRTYLLLQRLRSAIPLF